MAQDRIDVGILIFPDVEELDFVGPYEVFGQTSRLIARGIVEGPDLTVRLIARTVGPVVCANGMRVLPDASFAECQAVDVLLVPGGQGTRPLASDPETLAFIAATAKTARWITSVCTGSALLGAAGLLDNRPATTHWAAMDFLAACAPNAAVIRDRRVVEDGNLLTSAGVSAGIDMALLLVGRIYGVSAARGARKAMEYEPEPPFSQSPAA